MRVLFLASYFPRPGKPLIGTWALEQARALVRMGELHVVCCTPYVPGILGFLPKARPWASIPRDYHWPGSRALDSDDRALTPVHTTYLKGLYYPIAPFNRWAYTKPQRQMNLAWKSIGARLLGLVETFKPDVTYAHHSAVNGFFACRLRALRGIPFVVTDHDFAEIADCDRFPARRKMLEEVKTAAFMNVCVARRMEEDTKRIFPRARTQTIPNGINPLPPEIFRTPRPPELEGKQIILSAGMFTPRKGFPLLVEAFKAVCERFPAARLRIIGDGFDRPEIEAAIRRQQLQERVTLLGLQPQPRVFQEMAWADLFALVSWNEPFATVFIEAMGAGLPIITASDGGITDLVENGRHGLIVPPKSVEAAAGAMLELLADPLRRRQMGEQGKSLVETRLTWSANAAQMWELFGRAVDG